MIASGIPTLRLAYRPLPIGNGNGVLALVSDRYCDRCDSNRCRSFRSTPVQAHRRLTCWESLNLNLTPPDPADAEPEDL
jgi:hypothetical protein